MTYLCVLQKIEIMGNSEKVFVYDQSFTFLILNGLNDFNGNIFFGNEVFVTVGVLFCNI